MRRTTLKLDEDVLRRLKERAVREGRPLQSLANDLLRQGLVASVVSDYRLEVLTWTAKLQPGVDLFDHDLLFDRMQGRGGS